MLTNTLHETFVIRKINEALDSLDAEQLAKIYNYLVEESNIKWL